MTDNNHPIIPPPELVRDWAQKAQLLSGDDPVSFAKLLCNKAARWGADQELEACCVWLRGNDPYEHDYHQMLRAVRRPKPPSLKEQALQALDLLKVDASTHGLGFDSSAIRRALESLPD
jgi:hypothetical protein